MFSPVIFIGLLALYGCVEITAYGVAQDFQPMVPYGREDMIRGVNGITVVDVGDPNYALGRSIYRPGYGVPGPYGGGQQVGPVADGRYYTRCAQLYSELWKRPMSKVIGYVVTPLLGSYHIRGIRQAIYPGIQSGYPRIPQPYPREVRWNYPRPLSNVVRIQRPAKLGYAPSDRFRYSGMRQGYSGIHQGYSGMHPGYSGMRQGYSGMRQGYSGMRQGYSGIEGRYPRPTRSTLIPQRLPQPNYSGFKSGYNGIGQHASRHFQFQNPIPNRIVPYDIDYYNRYQPLYAHQYRWYTPNYPNYRQYQQTPCTNPPIVGSYGRQTPYQYGHSGYRYFGGNNVYGTPYLQPSIPQPSIPQPTMPVYPPQIPQVQGPGVVSPYYAPSNTVHQLAQGQGITQGVIQGPFNTPNQNGGYGFGYGVNPNVNQMPNLGGAMYGGGFNAGYNQFGNANVGGGFNPGYNQFGSTNFGTNLNSGYNQFGNTNLGGGFNPGYNQFGNTNVGGAFNSGFNQFANANNAMGFNNGFPPLPFGMGQGKQTNQIQQAAEGTGNVQSQNIGTADGGSRGSNSKIQQVSEGTGNVQNQNINSHDEGDPHHDDHSYRKILNHGSLGTDKIQQAAVGQGNIQSQTIGRKADQHQDEGNVISMTSQTFSSDSAGSKSGKNTKVRQMALGTGITQAQNIKLDDNQASDEQNNAQSDALSSAQSDAFSSSQRDAFSSSQSDAFSSSQSDAFSSSQSDSRSSAQNDAQQNQQNQGDEASDVANRIKDVHTNINIGSNISNRNEPVYMQQYGQAGGMGGGVPYYPKRNGAKVQQSAMGTGNVQNQKVFQDASSAQLSDELGVQQAAVGTGNVQSQNVYQDEIGAQQTVMGAGNVNALANDLNALSLQNAANDDLNSYNKALNDESAYGYAQNQLGAGAAYNDEYSGSNNNNQNLYNDYYADEANNALNDAVVPYSASSAASAYNDQNSNNNLYNDYSSNAYAQALNDESSAQLQNAYNDYMPGGYSAQQAAYGSGNVQSQALNDESASAAYNDASNNQNLYNDASNNQNLYNDASNNQNLYNDASNNHNLYNDASNNQNLYNDASNNQNLYNDYLANAYAQQALNDESSANQLQNAYNDYMPSRAGTQQAAYGTGNVQNQVVHDESSIQQAAYGVGNVQQQKIQNQQGLFIPVVFNDYNGPVNTQQAAYGTGNVQDQTVNRYARPVGPFYDESARISNIQQAAHGTGNVQNQQVDNSGIFYDYGGVNAQQAAHGTGNIQNQAVNRNGQRRLGYRGLGASDYTNGEGMGYTYGNSAFGQAQHESYASAQGYYGEAELGGLQGYYGPYASNTPKGYYNPQGYLGQMGSGMPQMGAGIPQMGAGIPQMGSRIPQMGAGIPQMGSGMPQHPSLGGSSAQQVAHGSNNVQSQKVGQSGGYPSRNPFLAPSRGKSQAQQAAYGSGNIQNQGLNDESSAQQAAYGTGNIQNQQVQNPSRNPFYDYMPNSYGAQQAAYGSGNVQNQALNDDSGAQGAAYGYNDESAASNYNDYLDNFGGVQAQQAAQGSGNVQSQNVNSPRLRSLNQGNLYSDDYPGYLYPMANGIPKGQAAQGSLHKLQAKTGPGMYHYSDDVQAQQAAHGVGNVQNQKIKNGPGMYFDYSNDVQAQQAAHGTGNVQNQAVNKYARRSLPTSRSIGSGFIAHDGSGGNQMYRASDWYHAALLDMYGAPSQAPLEPTSDVSTYPMPHVLQFPPHIAAQMEAQMKAQQTAEGTGNTQQQSVARKFF